MNRQQTLQTYSEADTDKRWRFYLQNKSQGSLLLRYAPKGWEDARYKIVRNTKYMGLFRSMTVNELTFVKDSRDFIQAVYEAQGINARIIFTVKRLNDSTQVYDDYFTGKIDLSTYSIEETGVKVGIIDSSIAEKFKNRENIKVNIRQRNSIEGYEIPAWSDEDPRLEFPEYLIQALAGWGINTDDVDTDQADHFVPLALGTSEFDEAQSQTITGTDQMFEDSNADRDLIIQGTITGIVVYGASVPTPRINILLKVNGVPVQSYVSTGDSFGTEVVFSASINENLSIVTGDDISIEASVVDYGETISVNYQTASVTLTENIDSVASNSGVAYPFYEALLRVCQIITDSNDCFKSSKFGRTDTPVVTYASDGQLGHIMKGLYMRNSTALNDTMAMSLSELFDSLDCLFMLGMGIESVSGTDKIVVEALTYFFDTTVVCDLSGKLRTEAIGKTVLPDMHYSNIKTGYNSYEYPETNDRGTLAEFNTKSEFSTVISVLDNALDLVCKFRGDTAGMVAIRAEGPTADSVKGDDNLFVVDSVRKVAAPYWLARTDEDFDEVTGGIDADQWYNLDFTPKRNLLRNGLKIRAGLERNNGTYLRWQTSDKNTLLSTRLSTESENVTENSDVLVYDLDEPMWWAEAYEVDLDFDDDDLQAILNNPKGLVKLATGKYGWILELEAGSKKKEAHLKLLRANLNYVTPIES